MSPAILVVRNHLRVAATQTTFTVAAVPLERVSDAKDWSDPTPHTGQAAALVQGPPEGALVGTCLLLPHRGGPPQNGTPLLRSQTLPRAGGFPDAEEAPNGGLGGTRLHEHGVKPRSFKVAPSAMPGKGSGAQVWSGATSAGLGMNRDVSHTPGEQLLLKGIPEVCPTLCKLLLRTASWQLEVPNGQFWGTVTQGRFSSILSTFVRW